VKVYWDTSAIINAFFSPEVWKRLERGKHYTRLHSFAEFFCTMTGRGIPTLDKDGNMGRSKLSPNDCAAWLRTFSEKVKIIEPDKEDTLDALDKAQARSIQGARVYDYLHALASSKAKANELLTRNTEDFQGLAANVHWP
jgi:predicted nucleic acid-binding protein